MKHVTYRYKIILCVLGFSFIVHFLFTAGGYFVFRQFDVKTNEDVNSKQIRYLDQNITSFFKDIDNLSSILGSLGFIEYSQNYLNLRDKKEADRALDELNNKIDNLHISPKMVKKILFIGNNSNQRNFMKTGDAQGSSSIQLPWMEDINETGLQAALLRGNGIPIWIEKGEIQSKMPSKNDNLTNDSLKRINTLIPMLEGELVLCNLSLSSLVIIVINQDFINELLDSDKGEERFVTLLDNQNKVILSNLPFKAVNISKTKDVEKGQEDTEWISSDNKVQYLNSLKTISPYDFKLVYSIHYDKIKRPIVKLLIFYGIDIIAFCALTFILMYYLSFFIVRPFRSLSGIIKLQFKSIPLQEIAIDNTLKHAFRRVPIRKKVFYAISISVLIPFVISSFIFSHYFYSYSTDKLQNNMRLITKQTSLNLENLMDSYYRMNILVQSDILEQYLVKAPKINSQEYKDFESSLISNLPRLVNYSYFILLDTGGNAVYQSIYSNNPELINGHLDGIKEGIASKKEEIFWLSLKEDIFGQPAIVLVKKITDSSVNSKIGGKPLGYFLMFLKQDSFQDIKVDSQSEFTILDDKGNGVYQSNPGNSSYQDLSDLLKASDRVTPVETIKKMGGIENIIISQKIPKTNWSVYISKRLDDVNAESYLLLKQNLFIALIIGVATLGLSLWLSSFLVKPIESIKKDMQEVGKGFFSEPLEYEKYDEIGELIQTYNTMIEQINKLMKENTDSRVREEKLATLKTQAELNMLQQQINPHFLYNTLEMINLKAMQFGEDKVSKMVSALAKLFRFSIGTPGNTVNLEQEVEHAKNYAAIQEMRFNGKFITKWNLDQKAMSCKVLKLIIQPLLENAINHGLYECTSGGEINVLCSIREERLIIEVQDNGIGMRPSELKNLMLSLQSEDVEDNPINTSNRQKGSSGIGLSNVNKRLHMYYKGTASLQIESIFMQGTKVVIMIPVENTSS